MSHIIKLRPFDDMHCHFRTGDLLREVLPFTALYCARAIAMPNIRPRAILEGKDVDWYRTQIDYALLGISPKPLLQPLMTIEIRDATTPKMVADAFRCGAVAGKVYPLGVTNNSDKGLKSFSHSRIRETFAAMEELGMLLLLHGELDFPRLLVTKREEQFLFTLDWMVGSFPRLKIVLEHISTKKSVEAIRVLRSRGKQVAATITAHHLCLTLNDVIGDGIRPHNMCMPVAKDFPDLEALLAAATGGEAGFFLGSDSAPHLRESKECGHGACGCFTAPILPCLLADIFEKNGKLEMLENFTSCFGAKFYGLPLNEGTITLAKEDWIIPAQCGSVVSFMAGKTLPWKLV